MTLLTICSNAADEIGIPQPSAVVASTQTEVEKLYRYANKIGNFLMKSHAWQILRGEKTFTSVAQEEQTSILPSDFDRIVTETFWNRSTQVLISGPITPVQWQSLKAANQTLASQAFYILRGGSLFVYSAPAAGNTLAFEYVKNTWARSSGGTAQTSFSADADTSVLDEELITLGVIYQYLVNDGQPAAVAGGAFIERLNLLIENDQPTASVLQSADIFGRNSRHFGGAPGSNLDLSLLVS